MAPQAQAPSATPPQVVQRTLNQTRSGWLEHQERVRRFDRAYDVYRANVRPSTTLKPWQSRLYVKYGMQVIDQAIANMIQGLPKATCKPRRPEDEVAAKAMEMVLGYYSDQDHLAQKEELVIKQALIYAVSPAKNFWYYKERDEPTRFGPRKVVECDRPCFMPWDAYDCWWDPYARDVDCSPYVVLRDWLTKEELLKKQFNPDTGYGQYQNLDLLFKTGPGEQPSSTTRNRLLDQPSNPYKDRFEILEVWRDDRLTVIGNRKILLADGPKPFWMAGKPVVMSSSRPDMFRVEGISETELVDHLQQALHMVTNLRMDNLKYTVQRGATYRESIADPTQLVMRPGFMWPVTDHDDIQFQDAKPLPPEAYQEEETLIGRLQYVTGITPYISGASGVGVDNRTATGVSLLQESASRLLTFKANQIRLNTWQRTFEQWAALTKQYLTKPLAVKIEGQQDAMTWYELGPEDVVGDFDIRILAGDESISRQQERSEVVAALQVLAPFAQAGLVNLQPILEKFADAYDMPRASLFPPRQQQPQAAPLQLVQPGQGQQLPNGMISPTAAQTVFQGNGVG